MFHVSCFRRFPVLFLAMACAIPLCRASHYEVLTEGDKSPIRCLVQDLRHPDWTSGHYLACYSQYFATRERWGGYFYGGFVAHPKAPENLLQFCSWQMSGKGVPAADIDFVYAGNHMSWAKSTWEGSAGGIKGMWPSSEFKENEWHRFVARTWAAPDDPSHSFVGIWMKDIRSGVWHHLATTRYPGTIVNLNHFFGFQENFAGGRADPVARLDIRNTYSLRDGGWVADNKVLFRAQGSGEKKERLRLRLIEGGKAVSLETLWSHVDKATPQQKEDPSFIPENQEISYKQPAKPSFFDPVKVKNLAVAHDGSRMYVKWDLASDGCPQLGYRVEVFDNAECKGEPTRVMAGNDPQLRSLLIETKAGAALCARLTLTDIFGNTGRPVIRTAVPAPLRPAVADSLPDPVPGLAYRYFEAAGQENWTAIPDVSKLTSVREGAVSEPDPTLRLRRTNYAFEFSGALAVTTPGIHDFTLVHASGAKLVIDGQTVIDADGYHSIGSASGAIPLAAGKHGVKLLYVQGPKQSQQYDDFLQLLWTPPGYSGKPKPIPTSAWSRVAETGEPVITLKPAVGMGNRVKLEASVSLAGAAPDAVEYYIHNPAFDYFRAQGALGGDYFIGSTKGGALETMLWNSPQKTLRARLIYGKNRTIDSVPVTFASTPPDLGQWTLSELEHHQYPVAAEVVNDKVSLVGESMALLTRKLTGDCTLVARLADITSTNKAPDGSEPDGSVWQAGIILRNDLNPSPGEPLGGKTTYAALLGCADMTIRDCDSLMINGAGNQPSGDRGRNKRWMKLQRNGNEITESLSEDGVAWVVNKTVTLPKLAPEIHAGFFIYALPSAIRIPHHASFDHVSLTQEAAR